MGHTSGVPPVSRIYTNLKGTILIGRMYSTALIDELDDMLGAHATTIGKFYGKRWATHMFWRDIPILGHSVFEHDDMSDFVLFSTLLRLRVIGSSLLATTGDRIPLFYLRTIEHLE